MSSPLIVIAGPTASGKSELAIDLAERWGAEILNADSQQVYREFDIGTAKPSPEQLGRVPHHLVSVVAPDAIFSAGQYQRLADQAIHQIQSRGKRVLLVGGTGLYLRALLHGLNSVPAADLELRVQLEAEAALKGREHLYERLRQADPMAAAKLTPNDLVRIIRALEIFLLTGVPASQHRLKHGFLEERYPYRLLVLNPPREALYQAIDRRTRKMFEEGLLDEVRRLIEMGFRDARPMKSVGYSEALAVVEGRLGVEAAILLAAQKTRHYAKRQWTWFRREPKAEWISPPYKPIRALVDETSAKP